ncbi:MAG: ABC transporter permease [Microscillaceae bacterium]|nr:ABC transporter permease [Microscillaceae bacterium]
MAKIIIDAKKRLGIYEYLREIIQYRELLVNLAYRDFKIRYARTLLGVSWTIVQPMLTLMIFTLIFQQFLKVNSGKTPYLLFALSGLFTWNYFAFVVSNAGASLISYRNIIQKVYFPHLVLPMSKALLGLGDMLINGLLLILLMLFYQIMPSLQILFLPLFIILLLVFSLGLGIWLCALSVYYRDLQTLMPFLLQIGIYLSPVAYPSTLVPDQWQLIYYLNPMAGILAGLRWCLFGEPFSSLCWISYGLAGFIFISGFLFFRKAEDVIVDIL